MTWGGEDKSLGIFSIGEAFSREIFVVSKSFVAAFMLIVPVVEDVSVRRQ